MRKQREIKKFQNLKLIRTSKFMINKNYFQFNKKIYLKKRGGVQMGSPVSEILAEFKLRKQEERIREFKKIIMH